MIIIETENSLPTIGATVLYEYSNAPFTPPFLVCKFSIMKSKWTYFKCLLLLHCLRHEPHTDILTSGVSSGEVRGYNPLEESTRMGEFGHPKYGLDCTSSSKTYHRGSVAGLYSWVTCSPSTTPFLITHFRIRHWFSHRSVFDRLNKRISYN